MLVKGVIKFHGVWDRIQLDQYGENDCYLEFYCEPYENKNTMEEECMYMLALPEFSDSRKEIELTPEMENQAYLDYRLFFRVSEQQWNELTSVFFESQKSADRNIDAVTFTFEELFGSYE
jgi:hypothetical protein